jgi:nucleotide-binding universal stress UspA family protein
MIKGDEKIMIKPIRSILFATDLTPNCQPALDFTIAVATRFQATIYMLHVIEKLPEQLSGRLKGLLGTHQWENMVHSHEMNAHKSLLGKQSASSSIREAINDFCKLEDIDDNSCDFKSSEIIISDGELVEEILNNAEKNECDLIVLGGHKNVFSRTALGGTAKGVLKKSKIAVTVVPSVVS